MSDTNQLIEILIKSNQDVTSNVSSLTQEVSGLTKAMGEFIVIEAARAEREKNQEEKNKRYDDFIDKSTLPIDKLIESQNTWLKVKDKVWAAVAFAVMAMLGFNFLG